MRDRARATLALGTWTAFLVVALVGLHALGDGPLGAPPVRGFARWLSDRGPATATFAGMRLLLLGTGWYLLGWTLLATMLRSVRADATAAVVEAMAPAPVRRLVRAAAGLSIAATVVAVSAASASESDSTVTMRRLPDAAATAPADDEPEAVTMALLPDLPPPTPTPTAATWIVAPGDHLWSIATRQLERSWSTAPTDAETDPYWRELIELNRGRLPDRSNPDLIVPALELLLPPSPPPPERARR